MTATSTDVNDLFVFVCTCLVFFMHVGFSMLEASSVQEKNRTAIVLKNACLLGVSGFAWWSLGYLVAGMGDTAVYGAVTSENTFIGTEKTGSDTPAFLARIAKTDSAYIGWSFQWVFSLTAATIVSGCVAERFTLKAYLIFAFCITGFIYPVVVAWCWRPNGWLAKAGNDQDVNNGFVDFAGSGVVHMVGGCCGMVAAYLVGPRKYLDDGKGGSRPRFAEDGTVNAAKMDSSSPVFMILGTLILWFGWFGFNPGTALTIATTTETGTVGLCLVNTILAPVASALVYTIGSLLMGNTDLTGVLNCILGGLVAVTCCCHAVQPWCAFCIIGGIACPVYVGSSLLLKKLKIDDVLDAGPVHFFCGMWGLFALGLFGCDSLMGSHRHGWFMGDSGRLFAWQLCGIISITLWCLVLSLIVLIPMHFLGMLRISDEEEQVGMDEIWAKHGTMSLAGCPPSPSTKTRATPAVPALNGKTNDEPQVQLQMNEVDTETRYCS